MLVNDLDLRVVGPGGTTHEPWILDPANPGNAAATGDNFRDNVEMVVIDAPTSGTYTVRITHKGSLTSAPQDFGLILTGLTSKVVLNLDIKPGSCPNPLNRKSKGKLPIGLLGTKDFDVTDIDYATIRLARADGVGGSVAPLEGPPGPHTVLADVGTPFDGEACDCHEKGPDGIVDLSMKFSTVEVVEALQLNCLGSGGLVGLMVSGALEDGTLFTASDCIKLVPPGDMDADNDVDGSDFITFSLCYNGIGKALNPGCPSSLADVDGDGDCDGIDFLTFSNCFSGSNKPSKCR
jgi:hypothetical protein